MRKNRLIYLVIVRNNRKGEIIMETNDSVKEFFNNPFSEEYLNYCSALIRQNVTAISVACNLLEDYISQHFRKCDQELIGSITAHCRELMRAAAVSEILASNEEDLIYISTDVFIGEFVSGCRSVLGDSVSIEMTDRSGGFVKTNETVLRYLLLGFLKNIIGSSQKPFKVIVGSVCNGEESIELYIRTDIDDLTGFKADSGVIGLSYEKLTELLAEKIGVSYRVENGSMTVTFKNKKDFTDPVFQCRPFYPSDGAFSVYNIMLAGSSDAERQIF